MNTKLLASAMRSGEMGLRFLQDETLLELDRLLGAMNCFSAARGLAMYAKDGCPHKTGKYVDDDEVKRCSICGEPCG